MLLSFRNIVQEDFLRIKGTYESGIASGFATFQTHSPSWVNWDQNYLDFCRIIGLSQNEIIGWVALSPYLKEKFTKAWLKSVFTWINSLPIKGLALYS